MLTFRGDAKHSIEVVISLYWRLLFKKNKILMLNADNPNEIGDWRRWSRSAFWRRYVSRLLPEVDGRIWQPAQMMALAQTAFDYGPRWKDIVSMQREGLVKGLAGYTPVDLAVCSKLLFCDIRFQTPQCATVIYYGYVSIGIYRYSYTTFLYF